MALEDDTPFSHSDSLYRGGTTLRPMLCAAPAPPFITRDKCPFPSENATEARKAGIVDHLMLARVSVSIEETRFRSDDLVSEFCSIGQRHMLVARERL